MNVEQSAAKAVSAKCASGGNAEMCAKSSISQMRIGRKCGNVRQKQYQPNAHWAKMQDCDSILSGLRIETSVTL